METVLDINTSGVVELKEKDIKKIEGGILVSIAAGIISYVVYEIADNVLKGNRKNHQEPYI